MVIGVMFIIDDGFYYIFRLGIILVSFGVRGIKLYL